MTKKWRRRENGCLCCLEEGNTNRQLSSSSCWMAAALAVPPTFQLRFAGIQFGDGAGPQRGQFRCRGKGHGLPHLLLKATNVMPLLHSKQRHRARGEKHEGKKTSKTVQRHRPAWHRQAGRMPVSTPLCNVNPQTKWAYLCSVQQKRKLKNKRKEEEGKNERCCPPLLAFTINRVGQPAQPIPKEVAGSNVSPDTPFFLYLIWIPHRIPVRMKIFDGRSIVR